MKILKAMKDGGLLSKVYGYFILEWKSLCSVVLLKFDNGSREVFHSHAFNCFSWVLKGQLQENHLNGDVSYHRSSLWPFVTRRSTFHQVYSKGTTWVLSFRGPWASTWCEYNPKENKHITLSQGRRVV